MKRRTKVLGLLPLDYYMAHPDKEEALKDMIDRVKNDEKVRKSDELYYTYSQAIVNHYIQSFKGTDFLSETSDQVDRLEKENLLRNPINCFFPEHYHIDEVTHRVITLLFSIALSFYTIQEYNLADEYFSKVLTLLHKKRLYNTPFEVVIYLYNARILIERGQYKLVNEKLLDGIQLFVGPEWNEEKIHLLIQWAYLFFLQSYWKNAEKLLSAISDIYPEKRTHNYGKLLYLKFVINRDRNMSDACFDIVQKIIELPNHLLEYDEWYEVHIFAGYHYANTLKDFENSIRHLRIANLYYNRKWMSMLSEMESIKGKLDARVYIKLTEKLENRMKEMILENNLHTGHYMEALKTSYERLEDLYKKVKDLSMLDTLTGLNNRRLLFTQSPQIFMLANRQNIPISIAMFDIDDFKKINDTYGHPFGDLILVQIAKLIRKNYRKSDLVIRYGGEEFLVVLFNSDTENSFKITERLRVAIENQVFTKDKVSVHVTVSVGICTSYIEKKDESQVLEQLIEQADSAMYKSKSSGKNTITTIDLINKNKK